MSQNNLKKIIIIFILLVILLFLFYLIFQSYQKNNYIDNLSDNLKLKTKAERIILYTEYSESGQPLDQLSSDTAENSQAIIKYVYVSDKVVPPAQHRGLAEDMSKRTPNSQSFLIARNEQSEEYVSRFFSNNQFYEIDNTWYQTEIATTTKQAFLMQTRPTLLAQIKTLFIQPVLAVAYYAGVGDGYVESFESNSNPQTSWDTAHDSITGTAFDNIGATANVGVDYTIVALGSLDEFTIDRLFLPFDTSAISDTAAIVSATLNIYVTSKSDTITSPSGQRYITVVQTTQASNTSLTEADYDQCGSVNNPTEGIDTGSRLTISAVTTSDDNSVSLNSTGVGWVSRTGYTNIGLRQGMDAEDALPTIEGTSNIIISTSEASGTTQDPYLEVVWKNNIVIINGGSIKLNGGNIKVNSM